MQVTWVANCGRSTATGNGADANIVSGGDGGLGGAGGGGGWLYGDRERRRCQHRQRWRRWPRRCRWRWRMALRRQIEVEQVRLRRRVQPAEACRRSSSSARGRRRSRWNRLGSDDESNQPKPVDGRAVLHVVGVDRGLVTERCRTVMGSRCTVLVVGSITDTCCCPKLVTERCRTVMGSRCTVLVVGSITDTCCCPKLVTQRRCGYYAGNWGRPASGASRR